MVVQLGEAPVEAFGGNLIRNGVGVKPGARPLQRDVAQVGRKNLYAVGTGAIAKMLQ